MTQDRGTVLMEAGGYHYIPGVMQYSAGVGAAPGLQIERATFTAPVPLAEGFQRIRAHLEHLGRPLAAFCACELRSPQQFSEDGFNAFNQSYADVLRDWNIMKMDDNPIARANVCPEIDAPSEPCFHAFSYTTQAASAQSSFVIAGSGEAKEGGPSYAGATVRLGDTSPDGMLEKAKFVLGEMERRMNFFDAGWDDVTATQLYTVYDPHPFLAEEVVTRGAARHGLNWHYHRPPVVGLDFEMDCRRVFSEHVLAAG
ncbi:MAG: hypothetical protein AB8B85_04450 [Paracoccaceae bacterium]